ncbi:macrophage mannose receptor 1-like [Penaeus indicus]|uniref:macrophage mannose receptor 1-like n=1 Tax=Penaeus indicus TaxID=29960 RepID=UPI00300C0FDD
MTIPVICTLTDLHSNVVSSVERLLIITLGTPVSALEDYKPSTESTRSTLQSPPPDTMLRLSFLLANVLSLVLCRSLPSNRDEDLVCPDGWTLLESSCFLVTKSSGNWFEGQDFCHSLEASLATVSSASQQKALSGILSGDTWIGLISPFGNHIYSWSDGSPFEFSSWAEGEPSTSGIPWGFSNIEACVEMRQEFHYHWNNAYCGDVKLFTCSRPADPASTTTTAAHSCKKGWEIHELSCYLVSETTTSWNNAKNRCYVLGGVLASINSEDEQTFVSGLLTRSAWIGLSDHVTEEEYVWVDGSPFNYSSWQDGEPSNSYLYLTLGLGEGCVEMKQEYAYRWSDEVCFTSKAFVCERPAE